VGEILEHLIRLDPEVKSRLRALGRYPSKDLEQFFGAEYKTTSVDSQGKERNRYNWAKRLCTAENDRELFTRHEMIPSLEGQGCPPDILVTNYSMLEYMLTRPWEKPLFDQTRKHLAADPDSELLLVLDEAHMYRGSKGAEIGLLVRRLAHRLGLSGEMSRFRVICTSASLGTGQQAIRTAKNFAADLTGVEPESVSVVQSTIVFTATEETASVDELAALSGLDIEAIHQSDSLESLMKALNPLLQALGISKSLKTEQELWSVLYENLKEKPYASRLLALTAGKALPISELARSLFDKCPDPERALSALLTVGSLARLSPGSPGLIPARIHLFFRGLNGLYACINNRCSGASGASDEVLGRLYSEPRDHCESCASRVFEMLSCHNCGIAYFQAYHSEETLHCFKFLWGECEDGTYPVQLLPGTIPPEGFSLAAAVQVDVRGGFVNDEAKSTEHNRAFYIPHKDGIPQREFSRCPCCQAGDPNSRAKIRSFRTNGEEPFTRLVEAQFSEQPPMSDSGPNRGRKVLIFSDGRQKAARLAPALEAHHTEAAFRQATILVARQAAEKMGQSSLKLRYLIPAMLHYCAERDIDLFPENADFQQIKKRARRWSLEQSLQNINQIFPEFGLALTHHLCHRFLSLQALGLARLPWDREQAYLLTNLDLELTEQDKITLGSLWLRSLLESRHFLPQNCSVSIFDLFERPVGIELGKPTSFISNRFQAFLTKLLGVQSLKPFEKWAKSLIANEGVFYPLDGRYFLQSDPLTIQAAHSVHPLVCAQCSSVHLDHLSHICTYCCGELKTADKEYLEARTGFYRDQVRRALQSGSNEPFGLATAEHSAQLTGSEFGESIHTRTELSEMRFQDIPVKDQNQVPLKPLDVLSCTTTMEVGIDIGNLTGVALRNVPPSVASYQQRAGRAGRRGKALASVLTYAQGSTHDTHYFSNPSDIICGRVREPIVYIENQRILQRHINAEALRLFFQNDNRLESGSASLFTSLGTVEEFLGEGEYTWAALQKWAIKNQEVVTNELKQWLPSKGHQLDLQLDTDEVSRNAIPLLLQQLSEALPLQLLARRAECELDRFEEDALQFQLKEKLLRFLIDAAILPRYAFPTDVVAFWVPNIHGAPQQGTYEYSPQRDLQIALTEYAPGRTLTIDKIRFTSAGFFSPYQPDPAKLIQNTEYYYSCPNCGYMKTTGAAQSDTKCPVCRHVELRGLPLVRPNGFAPDINQKRKHDRGQGVIYAGFSTPAQLEVGEVQDWDYELFGGRISLLARQQNLVVVNKGVREEGFRICPRCGRAEPEAIQRGVKQNLGARHRSHRHPLEGTDCRGKPRGPFYLGHKFPTDVLLLRLSFQAPFSCKVEGEDGKAGRAGLVSLVESLSLVASRVLQIDEGELAGNWAPVIGSNERSADIFFYDKLPGGAGYGRLFSKNLDEVFQETSRVLSNCTCEKSCYQCIRHYRNRQNHGLLDRNLALALLSYLVEGRVPQVDPERLQEQVLVLNSALSDGFELTELRPDGSASLHHPDGTKSVLFHHPFVQPARDANVVIPEYVLHTSPPIALKRLLGQSVQVLVPEQKRKVPPGYELLDPVCDDVAQNIWDKKLPSPVIGYELVQQGRVVGELEMAWPDYKIGLALYGDAKQVMESGFPDWVVFGPKSSEDLVEQLSNRVDTFAV